jgi:signal transduction histidine kinase
LGGVCGGIARATGIDVGIVRIAMSLFILVNGLSILIYAVAWIAIPLDNEDGNILGRAANDRRGIKLVIAVVPALIAVQIVITILHLGYLGFASVPSFLAVAVGILIWRNMSGAEKAMVGGGVFILVDGHTTAAALRPVGGAALLLAAVIIVLGPWWATLLRDLVRERQARAMAEDRAQMAAHVHDSVLQTLALIQRSADDPQNVVRLARAQERELRAWLFEGRSPGVISEEDASMLGEGIGVLQRHVEADHGITVQVVLVGDCDLTESSRALLGAAQEATVNAAKWSGATQVSLYAEVEPAHVSLFVRDRGKGFDPGSVPSDRQGIAQSMEARMARYGGTVVIRSSPGNGAEVELTMPR